MSKDFTVTVTFSEEEIRKVIVEKIAQDAVWRLDSSVRDKIIEKVDWSKMGPHIQEAVLKMAAQKWFKESR